MIKTHAFLTFMLDCTVKDFIFKSQNIFSLLILTYFTLATPTKFPALLLQCARVLYHLCPAHDPSAPVPLPPLGSCGPVEPPSPGKACGQPHPSPFNQTCSWPSMTLRIDYMPNLVFFPQSPSTLSSASPPSFTPGVTADDWWAWWYDFWLTEYHFPPWLFGQMRPNSYVGFSFSEGP